jgi:hypothetical protein
MTGTEKIILQLIRKRKTLSGEEEVVQLGGLREAVEHVRVGLLTLRVGVILSCHIIINQLTHGKEILCGSVADPENPYVFGPPGFGSGSISTRCGSSSGSFYNQAKIVILMVTNNNNRIRSRIRSRIRILIRIH